MKQSELRQLIKEEIENLQTIKNLENKLDVKVVSSSPNNLILYPDSTPDRKEFYDTRTSQKIHITVENGNYFLSFMFGYDRSIDSLAKFLNKRVRRSGMAGMSLIDLGFDKQPTTIDQLKQIINIMKKGLSDESKSQADFYRDSTPD